MDAATDRPLAVVTGASSGIGRELAKQFAANGFDLIVAAEDDAIAAAASELEGLGARVVAEQVDLSSGDGVERLCRRIDEAGRPVEAAALNAGVGAGGAFATDTDLADELRLIDLNVRSTVHLAKHLVRGAARGARGHGRVGHVADAGPDGDRVSSARPCWTPSSVPTTRTMQPTSRAMASRR